MSGEYTTTGTKVVKRSSVCVCVEGEKVMKKKKKYVSFSLTACQKKTRKGRRKV